MSLSGTACVHGRVDVDPPLLRLVGQIDVSTQAQTRAALASWRSDDDVLLDLSNVSFLDLAGVTPLLGELHRLSRLTPERCSGDALVCLRLLARACPELLSLVPEEQPS